MAVTKDQLTTFLSRLNRAIETYHAELYPGREIPTVSAMEGGKKYIRLVQVLHSSQRSVYCFVEAATGNLLKAAGWSAPELKHPRGSITDSRPLAQLTIYGAQYLKESDRCFPSLDSFDR